MRWLRMALLPLLLTSAAGAQNGSACKGFAKLGLPGTTILLEEVVPAGEYPPPEPSATALYRKLPAFCRVRAQIKPGSDSDIKIEVWLPVSGWNGRFRGQGNGGFAGEINYTLLAYSIAQGYASAGTDTGHSGDSTDASWAMGHPEKVVDFGNRAIHLMTTTAKSIVDAYYGRQPDHAYFASCSDGGREALMEAQRYPQDYDGILAGAPAYYWTNMVSAGMYKVQALTKTAASYVPASKIPALASAVRASCDAADGVKDGILNDPRACTFKPESMLCKADESNECLTPAQVGSLRMLLAPVVDARGRQVYPGSLPGAEDGSGGWGQWVVGPAPDKGLSFLFTTGYFKNMVYEDSAWKYAGFSLDEGLRRAVAKTAAAVNATDANLKPFTSRGGKLILYHGWNDPAISPLSTIDYYQRVVRSNRDAAGFLRLFMVPGMQHCSGGPGPSSFGQLGFFPGTGPNDAQHNLYLGLEQWVEKGIAPETVIAARIDLHGSGGPRITMTRPLCAYPLSAHYKGTGDTNDVSSFRCGTDAQ